MTTEAARREGLATILCLVNAERRERGRSDLRRSGRLAGVAQRHSADMARFKYVAHVDHAGRAVRVRVARSGYRARYAGEAIGWSTGTGRSPERLLRAVLADRAHRDAVFRSRYRELGVGLVLAAPVAGRRDGATVTLVLGRR